MTLKKRKNKYFRLPLKWKTVINTSGKLNISIWRWEETAHIKYPKYTKKAIKHQENKRNMGIFLFSLIEEPRCVTGFEFGFRNRKGPGGAPLNPPRAAELWCLPQNSSGTPQLPPPPHTPRDTGNAILKQGIQQVPSTLNTILQLKSELAFSVQPQRDSSHFN